MRLRSYDRARRRAQANADQSRKPWVVFQSTGLVWCCERLSTFSPGKPEGGEIVLPRDDVNREGREAYRDHEDISAAFRGEE